MDQEIQSVLHQVVKILLKPFLAAILRHFQKVLKVEILCIFYTSLYLSYDYKKHQIDQVLHEIQSVLLKKIN